MADALTFTASEPHLRRLERAYHAANTNRLIPARMTLGAGEAELVMSLTDEHLQAVGSVHGMLYFKAIDESGFYAGNTLVDDVFLTTASATVHLLAPAAAGDTMVARATVAHQTRSSILVDVIVSNEADEPVARGTLTLVRSREPLPPIED